MIDAATAKGLARDFTTYAKQFGAGAFSTPTADELVAAARESGGLVCGKWGDGPPGVAVRHALGRSVKRHDWLGDEFVLPRGSVVVTHLANPRGFSALPEADFLFAYADDPTVKGLLAGLDYEPAAVQITASSEIKTCWARTRLGQGRRYHDGDRLTVASWPVHVGADAIDELDGLAGWYDDYPFYSDGSWGALSLRGYWPDRPELGVKPSEMSKAWKAAHPADLERACDWTTLAAACPGLVSLACDVAGGLAIQRVRLLRMEGTRPGAGKPHRLGRHTDITDREAGTLPGQVIRFHVPLLTHPDVKMRTWSLDGSARDHHCSVGRAWYLDARKPHAVVNPSPVDRIHLTVDCVAGADTRTWLTTLEVHQ